MKNNITALCLILLSFSFNVKAQQGKDGVGNITVANTVVNIYTPLTASVTAGSSSITVGSAASFSVGDLIYIIQMQGATVNAYTYIWGDPNSALPNDTSQGKVKSYNDAGNNEFAQIASIAGNVITLDCALKNKYGDSLLGVPKTQVIRVPRYSSLTLSSPGTITCPAWNGSTGGVVVIEVQGNTTIGTGSSIDVSGKGFRGGGILNATGFTATNVGSNYNIPSSNNGAHKGESIVGDTNVYKRQNNGNFDGLTQFWLSTPLTINKGNVANGGGGGNANNCGGGGGSNGGTVSLWNGMGNPDNSTANNILAWSREPAGPVNGSFRPTSSSGGGRGGYAYSANNADPTIAGNGPGAGVWGGDSRHNDGGWGGTPLDYSSGKIFLGGGGGAGDSNDGNGTAGGNGGGIVYLVSYGTVTGAGQINANGASAVSTNWASSTFDEVLALGDDGAGGGGGGGAVFIQSSGSITLTNVTPITAQGGAGGDVHSHNTGSTSKNFGPGGGGGGGYVATSNAVTNNVNGGANGTVFLGGGNNTKIAQNFKPNGATAGGVGTSATTTTFYLTSTNYTICAGSSASLTVTANGTGVPGSLTYNWYNTASGGSPIFTGNPYNTGALTIGTYTYYAGTCPGTYRLPVTVTVLAAPSVSVLPVSGTTVCAGSTVTFTASGATTYTWSANAGGVNTATVTATPVGATTYTVTGANGTCTDVKTVTINTTPSPTITIAASNTVVCAGSPVTFTASGATNYTWSANAGSVTTATATANPGSNTTYTVTGVSGTCAPVTQTITVNTSASPTVAIAASNTLVCDGSPITFTASGATNYTWSANAGSVTTSTATVNPSGNTTYTVTGVSGTCPPATQTIAVNTTPSPTVSIAASNTLVCAGSPVTFTASGAASYTWSANAGSVTTSTATVNPASNTTYTVTGVNGGCPPVDQTITINASPSPTISIAASNTVVCVNSPVTFTASGASSYTWSANAGGFTTDTTTVYPSSNTTYTVTGESGVCPPVTQTVTVNTSATPSITIVASNTMVCENSVVTFTASGASSYTWSANAGAVNTATATANPSGNTTYSVTGVSGTCPPFTQTITVNTIAQPTVTIVASTATVCSGGPVTFTASGAITFTWSANAGSVTTNTVAVSPVASDTYTVTGDNGGGCTSTQTVSVNVTATPTVVAVSSDTIICNGSGTILTASGATTFTWSANAGSVTTATAAVTPTITTIYTVTGENSGCTMTQTVSVNVNNPPTQVDSVANQAACGSATGSYVINSVVGGTGPYQVNFNNTGFVNISSFPYTVSALTAASYPVVIKDNIGCTYTTSVIINNSGGITQVDSTMSSASCNPSNNGSITLNSVTGGTAPYQVDVNGGGFNTIPSFPYTISNLNAGTYTVVVKDVNLCQYTTLITVGSIGGITQVTTSVQSAVCKPVNSGSIDVVSVSGGTAPYQVSLNGGTLATMSSFPYALGGLIPGSYTILVQDAAGCTHTTTESVGIVPGPSSFTDTTRSDTCGRSVGTLNAFNVVGGVPAYQFSLNGSAFQSSGAFTGLATGLYTITVQDNNGCLFTQTDSVRSVGPTSSPTVTANGPTTFCQGGSVVLTSSSATGNTWSTGATTQTITVNATDTVSLTITQMGCTVNSNTVAVLVNPNPTIATNIFNAPVVCSGTTATLTASGATSYTWSANAGGAMTASVSVVPTTTGTITTIAVYTVVGTDANGCSNLATVTATVSPTAVAPNLPDTLYYCLFQNNVPPLHAVPSGGATTVVWTINGTTSADSSIVPATSPTGVTTYYAQQGGGGMCYGAVDSVKVIVIGAPNADFTSNPTSGNILAGQDVQFTPNTGLASNLTYNWDFDDTDSLHNFSNAYSPTHAYNNQGTYCVSLTVYQTLTGCSDTKTNCVEVLNGVTITVPNVFTPNDDNINEVFTVKTEGISDLTCSIYDRWGIKLYEWTGIAGFWNGTDSKNGKTVTDGTYYYIIEATDIKKKNHKYQGYLQLLR